MRVVLVLVLLLGGALGTAWLGGETWLARETARRIADDPRIDSAAVTPLRELSRIGLNLADVRLDTPQGAATLPWLDLWAAPTAPNEFHAALPPSMSVLVGGTERSLTAKDARVSVRVSPSRTMMLNRAAGVSGPVTLDGDPLLESADLAATLVAMGAAAPPAARASYRLDGRVEGVTPAALPPEIARSGPISAEGMAQVFLTAPVSAAAGSAKPGIVGVGLQGVSLRLGDRSLRMTGNLAADADHRLQGAVFVYTSDARGWLQLAAAAGLIPQATVALAGTAVATVAAADIDLPAGVPAPAPPADGELRIPVVFKDGKVWLGPLALAPAPVFPG